jgi:hypothetical protein
MCRMSLRTWSSRRQAVRAGQVTNTATNLSAVIRPTCSRATRPRIGYEIKRHNLLRFTIDATIGADAPVVTWHSNRRSVNIDAVDLFAGEPVINFERPRAPIRGRDVAGSPAVLQPNETAPATTGHNGCRTERVRSTRGGPELLACRGHGVHDAAKPSWVTHTNLATGHAPKREHPRRFSQHKAWAVSKTTVGDPVNLSA